MAQYKDIYSLLSVDWIKLYHDWVKRKIIMVITHRNIKIIDYLDFDYQYSFYEAQDLVFNRIKEVNYYLDAIWC